MRIFVVLFVIAYLSFSGCTSTPKRLDTNRDIVADTGELTRYELEKSATQMAKSIAEHFKNNPQKEGIFVALLPTKNDTSEQIPTDVFDNTLVNELRKAAIFTLRTETRSQALSEIKFSLTGLTEKELSIGKMKSPNFFIKTDIIENMFKHKGDKIVEQVVNIELIEVLTQVVVWSDKVVYRKKAVKAGGVGW